MDDLRAIVLTDGDPVAPPIPLPTDATVIAADGGLRLSPILGLRVDVVVGDMDSVSAAELAAAEQAGARIERHPTDKDATDLELASTPPSPAGPSRSPSSVGPAGASITCSSTPSCSPVTDTRASGCAG